jgi:phospholipase C
MRVLAVLITVFTIASSLAGATEAPPEERIDHVVVIVLQDATFDHMFGTYPGVNGIEPRRHWMRGPRGRRHAPVALTPADLGRRGSFPLRPGEEALSNGAAAARAAFNGGRMDGFLAAQRERDKHAALALRHYDRSTMPAIWALADEYVLFDRFFSATLGESLPNSLSLCASAHHGFRRGTRATLGELWRSDFPTIFDRADAAGISWRYYVGNFDSFNEAPTVKRGSLTAGSRTTLLYRAPVLSLRRFWEPAMRENLGSQTDFFEDAARGDVASISYILPSPNTNWPTNPLQSQARLLSIINALQKSPVWERTAAFVVWDDWGGFYDHVLPPRPRRTQLGFRVPALLISPLAKRGYVSSLRYDHTSIPAFIAKTFGMEPLREGRSPGSFAEVWAAEPRPEGRIFTIGKPSEYVAKGRQHGQNVLRLYLVGLGWTLLALALLRILAGRQARR